MHGGILRATHAVESCVKAVHQRPEVQEQAQAEAPSSRKPYVRPAFRREVVFETMR
jgi:hypothetical protein